jgi:hypothetical protein
MKIAILLYGDTKYGIYHSEYIHNLEKSFQVFSIVSSDEHNSLSGISNNFKVGYKTKYEVIDRIFFSIRCFLMIRKLKPDVVVTSYGRMIFILGFLIKTSSLLSKDRILTYYYLRSGSVSGKFDKLKNLFHKFESLFFDRLLIGSKGLAKLVYGKIPKNSIIIGIGGYDKNSNDLPTPGHFLNNDLKKELGIKKDELILLYVGVFTSRDLHQFIKELNFDIKNFKLLLVGYGTEESKNLIEEEIKNKKIREHVMFLGFLKYHELPKYYSIADVGICYIPLKLMYQHQPPFKLFQYLSYNIPTIITETDYVKEILPRIKDYTILHQPGLKLSEIETFYKKSQVKFQNSAPMLSSWVDVTNILKEDILKNR